MSNRNKFVEFARKLFLKVNENPQLVQIIALLVELYIMGDAKSIENYFIAKSLLRGYNKTTKFSENLSDKI